VVGKGTTFTVLLRVFEQKPSVEVPAEVEASYRDYLSLPRFVRRKRVPETRPENAPEP
jgi:hypothetical protein